MIDVNNWAVGTPHGVIVRILDVTNFIHDRIWRFLDSQEVTLLIEISSQDNSRKAATTLKQIKDRLYGYYFIVDVRRGEDYTEDAWRIDPTQQNIPYLRPDHDSLDRTWEDYLKYGICVFITKPGSQRTTITITRHPNV
jgi:hypothetical protein